MPKKPLILLVDDNAGIHELLCPILTEKWAVQCFLDGSTALQWARRVVPDLILTDVLMPGLNGIELLRQVRADPRMRTVPVVLISSRTGEESLVEACAAQADAYIEKPFSLSQLVAQIDSCLRLWQLRCGLAPAPGLSAAWLENIRDAFEDLDDEYIALSSDGLCLYANRKALLSGARSELEVLNRHICEAFSHLSSAPIREQLQRVLLERSVAHFETFVSKTERWIEYHLYPSEYGFCLHGRDMTARKRSTQGRERLLQELLGSSTDRGETTAVPGEAGFRQWIEAGIVGAFAAGRDGRIFYANDGFLNLLGYSKEDVHEGRLNLNRLAPADWQPSDERAWEQLSTSGACPPYEKEMFHRNGSRIPTLVGGVLSAEAGVERFLGFVLDLTPIKKVEQASQQARRQLAEHAAELEQRVEERTAAWRDIAEQMEGFCYTVAHDLRAPLRAMEGFAQALMEDYGEQLDATAQTYISRIISGAQRLDLLINDLLSYSRLSRRDLQTTVIDLDYTFAEVRKSLSEQIQARNAKVAIEGPLPRIRGDWITVQEMLGNLLSNAIKFVAKDVEPQVRVHAEETEAGIRIWVEDNGIGIAPEHQERIFRVFERLHGFEEYAGTGIGLAIVQRGATRLGGRVGVVSEPGRGSKFWIELPKAD